MRRQIVLSPRLYSMSVLLRAIRLARNLSLSCFAAWIRVQQRFPTSGNDGNNQGDTLHNKSYDYFSTTIPTSLISPSLIEKAFASGSFPARLTMRYAASS